MIAPLRPASAQTIQNAQPGSRQDHAVHTTIDVPGAGRIKLKLLVMPQNALQVENARRQPFDPNDPILFSTFSNLDGIAGPDPLWFFPTIGYDESVDPTFYLYPQTLQTGVTAPNNVLDIFFGELGSPALISRLRWSGNLFDVNNFGTPTAGSFAVFFWNGVDGETVPSDDNLAVTETGGFNGYLYRITTPFTGVPILTSNPTNRMQITNTRGKFGVCIAKVTDSGNPTPTSVQWFWTGNTPNGPNAVYRLVDGFYTSDLTFVPADTSNAPRLNQGVEDRGTLNYLIEFGGRALNNTIPARGALQGNIRRRGIDVPAPNTPENAPGRYAVTLLEQNTATIVRRDFIFTQPSYDSSGALIDNYVLQGIPAGTYDVVIEQLPIFGVVNNMLVDDVSRPLDTWPFADFVPSFTPGVVITNGGTTALDSRLERFGDIDDGSGTGTRDGAVDVLDLDALIMAFDTFEGDPGFLPSADLAGDPSVNFGAPDGSIDVYDLDALINTFDTGEGEIP